MEHVVFFPAPDGTPAFRRFGTVDDAARFVEHLRNVENVSGASVHAMTEVPLAFKAWYRVELPDAVSEAPEASAEDAAADAPDAPDAPDQVTAEAPATIAEVLQSYGAADVLPGVSHVELHEVPQATGSVTGILVPERDANVQLAAVAPLSEQSLFAAPEPEPERAEAQVLEPAFGSRRERGSGYFVR